MPPQAKPLNTKDYAIIEGLCRYWYLLPEQVMRRYWTGKSLSRAHDVLMNLTRQEYARVIDVPRSETRGKKAWAYGLGPKGLSYLKNQGMPTPKRLHLTRQPSQQLPQTLCINDVLIAAHNLARYQDAVKLTGFIHEQDLHIAPNHLIYPDGSKRDIEFDGVLYFDITDRDGTFEQVLLLETDMGSSQRYWKEKISAYIAYLDRHYVADYQTESATLVIYTPAGETHMRNLIRWTEQVLDSDTWRGTAWPEIISFTYLPADTTNPVDFFLSPTWSQPFSATRSSPLEVHLG